jgi:predicted membrane-bound spermidine synthase
LCVALTTLATLLLELSLTRIFSVVLFYHFAFLAISIALFGLGAGGVFSYVVADRPGNVFSKLGRLSALNGLLVVFALAAVLWQREELTNMRLAILFFTTSLPFFVSGIIVSLAISEGMARVDRVYFFDLIGAAGGCLLLDPLLRAVGGENTIIVVALLFAATAAVWHAMAGSLGGRVLSVALGLALLGLIVGNWGSNGILKVHYAKGQKLNNEFFVKWNSFSRIAATRDKDSAMIFIDADASTGIANFDFEHLSEHERRDLQYQGPGLPYMIIPGAKTLIIGPGGGWDVARALSTGSGDITAVEINPLIAQTIMQQRYPELSRGLYLRPEVHLIVEDGRSFVRRSQDKYQVIQATLVDTWASTAAGAFALSENNLYTTDAFADYLGHLTDDGFLAFQRWGLDPPRESLRLIALGIAALNRMGETDASRHFIVVREGSVVGWGAKDTVLISRKPFSAEYVARARRTIAEGHMQPVYLPDETIANPFNELLHSPRPSEYERNYRFDISPVSDNRPFFFYTVQPRDLWTFITRIRNTSADDKINQAVPLLFGLMAVSIAATLIILALPPILLGARLPRRRGVLWFLLYFIAIGAGYILVEVALIQKFVLFLGHPTYALTVVIFSMLLSSGMGSFWSRRLVGQSQAKLSIALGAVVILVGAMAAVVSPLVAGGVGWPQWLKIATAVVLIFPAGFAMGMPFPSGLKRLEARQESSVRWAWSLNAAASVMGSAGAIVCAIYFGLIQTLLIGAALYGLSLVILGTSFKTDVGC